MATTQPRHRPRIIFTFVLAYSNVCSYHSAGAPGIPLPAEGTITAFLSSVSVSLISKSCASRSASSSVLSGEAGRQSGHHFLRSAFIKWRQSYTTRNRRKPHSAQKFSTQRSSTQYTRTMNNSISASLTSVSLKANSWGVQRSNSPVTYFLNFKIY